MDEEGKRVIIIEDDEAISELERDYLEMKGYSCEIIADGNEAFSRIHDMIADLYILDIMLPHVSGYRILEEIRKISDRPVIVVSARNDDLDKIQSFGIGADDYMVKPFSGAELTARVKAHLMRYEKLSGKREEPDEIRIRDLVLRKNSREVFLDGNEIVLTNKEFDLLFYLCSNPDRAISKGELFREVWKMDSLGDLATVGVHIKKLREKMEKSPESPDYIETIWGVGYKIRKM